MKSQGWVRPVKTFLIVALQLNEFLFWKGRAHDLTSSTLPEGFPVLPVMPEVQILGSLLLLGEERFKNKNREQRKGASLFSLTFPSLSNLFASSMGLQLIRPKLFSELFKSSLNCEVSTCPCPWSLRKFFIARLNLYIFYKRHFFLCKLNKVNNKNNNKNNKKSTTQNGRNRRLSWGWQPGSR